MAYPLDFLRGRRLLAFSAIARNEDFRQMVVNLGGDIVKFFPFPDHHYYSDDDLRSIAAWGERLGAEFLITTEKDYVRVGERLPETLKLLVLTVAISFGVDTQSLENYVKKFLRTGRQDPYFHTGGTG
jgi:tetraacyldisaccharide 4'-kinase